MSEIKSVVSSVCTALIVLGVLKLLVPDGRTKRTTEIVFGIATILAIVLPVFSANIGLDGIGNLLDADKSALEETVSLSTEQMELSVASLLEAAEIPFSKISVEMDISDEGGISIECVKILGVPPDKTDLTCRVAAYGLNIDMEDVEVWDDQGSSGEVPEG